MTEYQNKVRWISSQYLIRQHGISRSEGGMERSVLYDSY